MTQMAGTNPKLAAIFGGGGFGMKTGAMNNAAFQDRSALQMAATNADAQAAIGEKDAEAMIEAAKYGAAATRAQGAAAGQSAMFGGLSSGISSLAGGFAGMGGGSSFGSSAMSPGGSAGVAGIGGGSMTNPFSFNRELTFSPWGK